METVDIFKNEHYGRGMRLYDCGLFTEAIVEFEQVIQSAPEEHTPERRLASFFMGEAYTTLGLTHLRMNMYRRAEEELRFALALHPEYADLRFYLAVVYYKMSRYEAAEEHIRKALSTNPNFARALIYFGLILLRRKDEVGLAEIANGIALESAYDREKYAQALSYYRTGKIEDALQALEELADTDVDRISNLLEDGMQAMQNRNYKKAFGIFEQAVSMCPEYPDLRQSLGKCCLRLGMVTQAIEQLRKAIQINPSYVVARVHLAEAYEKDGKRARAVKELEHALKIDPMNLAAERALKALKKEK